MIDGNVERIHLLCLIAEVAQDDVAALHVAQQIGVVVAAALSAAAGNRRGDLRALSIEARLSGA